VSHELIDNKFKNTAHMAAFFHVQAALIDRDIDYNLSCICRKELTKSGISRNTIAIAKKPETTLF